MPLKTNPDVAGDSAFLRFRSYLLAERGVSPNTWEGYSADIAQFATFVWGEGGRAPFAWSTASDAAARAFLASFGSDGARATTLMRKLAALRTFYRFLQREGLAVDNPFSFLRGPRKAKALPKVLSVSDVERELGIPVEITLQDGADLLDKFLN